MEGDILLREQEFHKINSELEQRTHRILQEMEAVRSRAAAVSIAEDTKNGPRSRSFCLCDEIKDSDASGSRGSSKGGARQRLGAKRESCTDDDQQTLHSNGMGYEATNRLLRAKLTILNKEVDTLRQEYKTKTDECRRVTADLSHSEEERARMEAALTAAKESAANLHAKLESANSSLARLQVENSALNKNVASLKKEIKQQKQHGSTVELRLNRALEEADKLRTAAKQTQLQHKEERDQQRHTIDKLQTTIKGLERQRTELMTVCTKQLHLIENLRRQKAHLQATRFAHTAEMEFDNMLDWCLKNELQPTK